jgi:hypothetical protein
MFLLFIGISIIINCFKTSGEVTSFVLGIIGCCSTLIIACKINYSAKFEKALKKCNYYFLPIFLMHTLFAATLRVLLLKMDVISPIIHIIGGVTISFVGPILATFIISKIKWLDFIIYPNKYLKKESDE